MQKQDSQEKPLLQLIEDVAIAADGSQRVACLALAEYKYSSPKMARLTIPIREKVQSATSARAVIRAKCRQSLKKAFKFFNLNLTYLFCLGTLGSD
jgi:ERCC4-related helicase